MGLYSNTFYSSELNQILSEEAYVEQMLRVEAVLASSQAQEGIIPETSASIIARCAQMGNIDLEKLKSEIVLGGNAAIPLVKQLTYLVKFSDFEASKHVHLGATSQDIIDTATVLQLIDAFTWMEAKSDRLLHALKILSQQNQETLMIGRTLLQQAKPITFGLKVAHWYRSVSDDINRIKQAVHLASSLQMGGAVGAGNAKLTDAVTSEMARLLDLQVQGSWQSARGNLCAVAAGMGILAGDLGKIARDISLLMQTEVGEVFEGAAEGKGGSSTMPHKRNPVNCALILANATRIPSLVSTMLGAMVQEHERSAGMWHAEWETLHQILALTGGMIEKTLDLITGLEVHKDRMLENLELTRGLIYAENVMLAMAAKTGKLQAHELVEKACKISVKTGRHLKELIAEYPGAPDNLDELFSSESALNYCREMSNKLLKE